MHREAQGQTVPLAKRRFCVSLPFIHRRTESDAALRLCHLSSKRCIGRVPVSSLHAPLAELFSLTVIVLFKIQ